jgi:hypothetical protein
MIINIIKTVESSNNQYAFRFEEKLYFLHRASKTNLSKILKRIRMINQCSNDTAIAICSTSWGLYQILGINIYGVCGYDKSIINFLKNVEDQEKVFKIFCDIQRVDLEKTEKELTNLAGHINKNKNYFKNNLDMINFLENELRDHKENYLNLIMFIERYNGAKYLSNSFMDYLLRMITEAKKYIKNTN